MTISSDDICRQGIAKLEMAVFGLSAKCMWLFWLFGYKVCGGLIGTGMVIGMPTGMIC